MLVSIESSDKLGITTLSIGLFRRVSSAEKLRRHSTRILHRTEANEPLRTVQQTQGQKGFEAWLAIVRNYGQRNMFDKNSPCTTLISNVSERDRVKTTL